MGGEPLGVSGREKLQNVTSLQVPEENGSLHLLEEYQDFSKT